MTCRYKNLFDKSNLIVINRLRNWVSPTAHIANLGEGHLITIVIFDLETTGYNQYVQFFFSVGNPGLGRNTFKLFLNHFFLQLM